MQNFDLVVLFGFLDVVGIEIGTKKPKAKKPINHPVIILGVKKAWDCITPIPPKFIVPQMCFTTTQVIYMNSKSLNNQVA